MTRLPGPPIFTMTAENNKLNVVLLGFLRALLSRRDWIYLLSLLIPFLLYDLALKSYDVTSQPDTHGLARTLDLMRADMFFDLGYVLFWIGLFVAMCRGKKPVRWAVILLMHTATVLAVLVAACAHWYFQETGATLDYATIAERIPSSTRSSRYSPRRGTRCRPGRSSSPLFSTGL